MNILVTNFSDSGEDVMIFTEKENITPSSIIETLKSKGETFDEVYEVKDDELQYYCYEPCYI